MEKKDVMACLKALGDETRVRMILLLMRGELCVCQINEVLGISQPLASRHLSILRTAGLVDARREGKMMYYSLSRQAQSGGKLGLIEVLRNALKNDRTVRDDRGRLGKCHREHGVRKGSRGNSPGTGG